MAPFGLSLLLLTFALEIPPILQHGEALIAEGASWDVVIRVLATLVPQALGITIPMALLVGLLITLGRLSADREIVAMEACGVSLGRLLRPLLTVRPHRDGGHDLRHDRRAAVRKSSIPGNYLQAAHDARRNEDQAARFLHGVPESRHLRSRGDARGWLERCHGVREQHADAAQDLPGEAGPPAPRRGETLGANGAVRRLAPLRQSGRARQIRAGHVRANDARHRSGKRVPAHRADEGLHGNDHRRAAI